MKKLLSACLCLVLLDSCGFNEFTCVLPSPTYKKLVSVKILNSEGKNQLHPATNGYWQYINIAAFAHKNNEKVPAEILIKSNQSDYWLEVEIGEYLQMLYAEKGAHDIYLSFTGSSTDTLSWDNAQEDFYLNGEPWTERDGATGALILKKEVL